MHSHMNVKLNFLILNNSRSLTAKNEELLIRKFLLQMLQLSTNNTFIVKPHIFWSVTLLYRVRSY